jgi:predicted aspartyl protease
MVILVSINGVHLIALLDFGSTHNFIDNTKASRAGVTLAGLGGLCVAVTNGDK